MIILGLVLILVIVSFNLKPEQEDPSYQILIADQFYNSLFDDSLYTSCRVDMSFLRLLKNFYAGAVTSCDDGSNVKDYLEDFINATLDYFLKANNLAYYLNITDRNTELIFQDGICDGVVYSLPTQVLVKPKESKIWVHLKVCKKKK